MDFLKILQYHFRRPFETQWLSLKKDTVLNYIPF